MQERFLYLLNQYYQRQASPEELEEFYALVNSGQYDDVLKNFMDDAYAREILSPPAESTERYYPPGADSRILHHVFQSGNNQAEAVTQRRDAKIRPLWPRIAAAASILLVLSVGGYFLLHKQQAQPIAKNPVHDIAPGHNQATLTLANGQKIILTKGLSGKIAQQGNTQVQVNSGQAIAYTVMGQSSEVSYNTLTTKKGEQSPYPLVLADGSKVWLNAASSITFPTAFNGKERLVKVTGEAYFEVAHNENLPFYVVTSGQTIADIGTHFNVNAYADEPVIKTTLLEGAVKVSLNNGQSTILNPGEQSVLSANLQIKLVKDVNLDEAVAWKNGLFSYSSAPLEIVMRQISRWYDVEVVYQSNQLKYKTFSGSLSRYDHVSRLLNSIAFTGPVKFKIEGKKIIVTE